MKQILTQAAAHATGAAVYILSVATFITNADRLVDSQPPQILGIAGFLTLFVISAAVMGLLIFARPLMWFINGQKKEAILLAFSTIGILGLIALSSFSILVAVTG